MIQVGDEVGVKKMLEIILENISEKTLNEGS